MTRARTLPPLLVLLALLNGGMIAVDDLPATSHPIPDTFPHPVIPVGAQWPGVMLKATAALFLLALLLGPLIRRSVPQDLPPPTHSHDEPPGASGLHGPSGTLDPNPPESRPPRPR